MRRDKLLSISSLPMAQAGQQTILSQRIFRNTLT
jgi:hypothetical protein